MSERVILAAGAKPQPPRKVVDRQVELTAALRCQAYAAYSELMGSPHDIDPQAGCAAKVGLGESLPHATGLDALLAEVRDADLARLRREYSGLFEVGSDGPPVPVREDLQTGQRGSTREEIVRFYEFFGYELSERFAWAPDHLSVELEFMHYLCFREAEQESSRTACQLAQLDFSRRHLARWIPRLRQATEEQAPGSLYARIVASLDDFVTGDLAWQQATVVEDDEPGGSTSTARDAT